MQTETILAAVAAFAFVAGSAPCHAETTNSVTVNNVAKKAQLELDANQKTRYHNIHYNFGHKWIPESVFKHSIHFRESLDGTDTEFPVQFGEYLVELWNDLWRGEPPETAAPGIEIIAVNTGTNATDKVNGFLITFPEPLQLPDNYFAFIFVDKNRSLRYLTYERTNPIFGGGESVAVLCGWHSNGGRANYGLIGGVTRDEFIEVLKPFLLKESPPAAIWNPTGGEIEY